MTSSSDSLHDITALRQRFAQLERPRRSRSTRDIVLHELMPEIEKKLSRGWRYADIVAGLREVGISVSANTLRHYVAKARQNRGKSKVLGLAKPAQGKSAASKHAANAVSPTIGLPATTESAKTSSAPVVCPRKRKKQTAFAGFDETP